MRETRHTDAQSVNATPGEVRRALNAAGKAFVAIGVFSFFINLLYLVSPIFMLQVYDRVLTGGRYETLFFLTLIACLALVVFGILEALRGSLLARTGQWLYGQLGSPTLAASFKSSLGGDNPGGRAMRDLQQLQSFLGGPPILPFFDAPWMPIFIFILFMLHPWIGVLALITAVLLFALALLNEVTTRKLSQAAAEAEAGALQHAERSIANAEAIQAMGMLSAVDRRWQDSSRHARDKSTRAAERGAWIHGASRAIRMIAQVGVLAVGAVLVLRSEFSAGAMIAGSILLGRALAPVEQSISAWRGFTSARASYRRLSKLHELHPREVQSMNLPAPVGHLSVEKLIVRAPNSDTLLLANVSFKLSPGEVLVVVGPSAAGKSTLCRALTGVIQPFRGAVRLDGAALDQYPEQQRGAAIGYLPQFIELFDGTVRENIARLNAGEPEAVIDAARLADVHDMVLNFPDGYDTRLGTNGLVLSGGQKQRLGLARAVYGGPKLVVLDEPNSHLDQSGEAALLRTIQTLKERGTAVVMVAHRKAALNAADRMLVLNKGTVDIFGERDEVLKLMAERARFASQNKPQGPQAGKSRNI